jgi:hypothetical protein
MLNISKNMEYLIRDRNLELGKIEFLSTNSFLLTYTQYCIEDLSYSSIV